MASTLFLSLPIVFLLAFHLHPTLSLTCTTQPLPQNKLFQHCQDLPSLASFLHWTYTPSNSTLSIAFLARPSAPAGWISWSINPTAPQMLGSQALIAYRDPAGAITVNTFNVSAYRIAPSKIDYRVVDMAAEESGGVMRIFATLVLPESLGSVINQVWQVGGSVKDGVPEKHAFSRENLNAVGKLDLVSGGGLIPGGGVAGGGDSRLKKKNIHGILNVVSWGILFPVGIIIARYMRIFESADPAWFYLHLSCQLSAYIIGVAGWGTGLKLGSQSQGIRYTSHRNIGIVLFSFATLQIFALFLRPKKEHKYRQYWNFYHHGVGYLIVVLGIINVFKGLDILVPEKKWRSAYIIVLAVLGGIALLLEAITWVIVLKRKSKKSTKPYDGHSGA